MSTNNSGIKVQNLYCNQKVNPIAVETLKPYFSWSLVSQNAGDFQTGYRILVSSSRELLKELKGDLWDSGFVESENSIHIPYCGQNLSSTQKYLWMVIVRDMNMNFSQWSHVAFFETGLLNRSNWKARWICRNEKATTAEESIPAPLFRKSWKAVKKIEKARAYICGLGFSEIYLNGEKISKDVLSPAVTAYDKTVLYNSYDITGFIKDGKNVCSAILGNGFYNAFTETPWNFKYAPWVHHPKLLIQIHLIYEDGEMQIICSDTSWKTSSGPIIFDGLRNGEFYDSRLEIDGWDKPDFDDSKWDKAVIAKPPGGILRSSGIQPIKKIKTIVPKSFHQVSDSTWVFDMGINISGWVKINVSENAGTEIVIRYAEKLNDDGTIDTSEIDMFTNSGCFQTDKYISNGKKNQTWEPRFTYHGFRYVQIKGPTGKPDLSTVTGCQVHTAFSNAGDFECSNDLLNSIQKIALQSSVSNFHGIPTDCPHREKNGWTGDAHISSDQLLLNYDCAAAYQKWMQDFKDAQRPSGQIPGIVPTGGWGYNWGSGPAWDSAIIMIPWNVYLYTGDTAILEFMYESMKNYLLFLSEMAENNIVGFSLGDWCPPVGGNVGYKCPKSVTDTAYYYIDTLLFSKIAKITGNISESNQYLLLAREIRKSFREAFFDSKTGIVEGNCQTSMSCALFQGLIDDEEKELVLGKLIEQVEVSDFHIDCGILGTKYILHTLSRMGRTNIAYKIATQTSFPGWGNWVEKGLTTMSENWSGKESGNHHMFSDISAWFYKSLAGINPDPDCPGFKHVIFTLNPVEGLIWTKAGHLSLYGEVRCEWKVLDEELIIDISLPVNSHGTLYIPENYSKVKSVFHNNLKMEIEDYINKKDLNYGKIFLKSGEYKIIANKVTNKIKG